ncbi:MAG TPA: head GIN domain-containing protein [Ignavibacteriales bacterium]|nr:head GIN domain-containing protein [Ignavibacteriales bacterium]
MNRSKLSFLSFLLVFILTGCNINAVRGNGNEVTEKRGVSGFTKIDVGGAYAVNITLGDTESLEIIGDENLMKYIRTEVDGGVLHIYNKKSISPRRKLIINITALKLDEITSSGATSIVTRNYKGESLFINGSGASSMELDGETQNLDIDLSGAVAINAKNLKAQFVKVGLSGAAGVEVFASEELEAAISGVGSIEYYGNPKVVKKEVSGLGSVHKKE